MIMINVKDLLKDIYIYIGGSIVANKTSLHNFFFLIKIHYCSIENFNFSKFPRPTIQKR